MIETMAAPKGSYIIQTAAGSALGRMLIRVCKHHGIKTINIVRRKELEAELKAIGADVVLTEDEDIPARVKEITGGAGAWAAVDAVTGELTGKVMGGLRDHGSVYIYGLMSGLTFTGPATEALFRCV